MYNQEREVKKLRAILRNKERIEGCITEASACKEIMNFSITYFSRTNNVNSHMSQYVID
jgi:hypothetical protein